jgi:hypothetical protein
MVQINPPIKKALTEFEKHLLFGEFFFDNSAVFFW